MPDNPLRLKSIHHVEFWSATPSRRRSTTARPSASRSSPTPGSRPAAAIAPRYALRAGQGPPRPDDRRYRPTARSPPTSSRTATASATSPSTSRTPTPPSHEAVRAGRDAGRSSRTTSRDAARRPCGTRPSRPTATRSTRSIAYRDYTGPFLPGFVEREVAGARDAGLLRIDHMVGNVELGRMNHWARLVQPTCSASRATSASTTRTSRPSTAR